jgi:hypothetical protein
MFCGSLADLDQLGSLKSADPVDADLLVSKVSPD